MKRRTFLLSSSLFLTGLALGTYYWERRWKYITIHHSAGLYGNIPFLQRVHRERQPHDPIDAIPYHFIIGNGKGMGMGEVASDWRNDYQLWGTHVSRRNLDRNLRGFGICLIGNFEKSQVPPAQYRALVDLTKTLMSKYDIPPENVNGHGYVPGERTKCPGKNFPMEKFLGDIG